MSGVQALAKPHRIKAAHRRRRKIASGQSVQRYYDPGIGRFLSVDPVSANSGAGFNRYSYAANNPYRYYDPDGRVPKGPHDTDLCKSGGGGGCEVGSFSESDALTAADEQRGRDGQAVLRLAYWPVDAAMSFFESAHDDDTAGMLWAASAFIPAEGLLARFQSLARKARALSNTERMAINGETTATRLGREMHATWNYGPGFEREFRLPSGKRVDAINFGARHVVELKPNNPRAIRLGQRQLKDYLNELNGVYPGETPWTGSIQTY